MCYFNTLFFAVHKDASRLGSSSVPCVGDCTSCLEMDGLFQAEAYVHILTLLFENVWEPSTLVKQRQKGLWSEYV